MVSPEVSQEMPSLAKPSFIMRRFCGAASSTSISPRVAAARPMRDPTSMKSLPMRKVAPESFFTPSMVRMLEPIPAIRAAHGDQHAAEVLHVRLRGGVLDDGGPLREDRRHEDVLRGGDGGLVQEDRRAHQPVGGSVKNVPTPRGCPAP